MKSITCGVGTVAMASKLCLPNFLSRLVLAREEFYLDIFYDRMTLMRALITLKTSPQVFAAFEVAGGGATSFSL